MPHDYVSRKKGAAAPRRVICRPPPSEADLHAQHAFRVAVALSAHLLRHRQVYAQRLRQLSVNPGLQLARVARAPHV